MLSTPTPICKMPFTGRSLWIVAVSSMEQIIGTALSTVVGVMLPMLQLTLHPEMPAFMQGFIGAIGLVGIAVGSALIGKLSDRQGYLLWFRLCPLLIVIGALLCLLFPHRGMLMLGMVVSGLGVGGGYSLDSAYISELMPERWRQTMVGIAKATCALGFIGAAVVCHIIISHDPNPHIWPRMILVILVLGVATLLMRIHWAESPKWLVEHGRMAEAQQAIAVFFGKNSGVLPNDPTKPVPTAPNTPATWLSMFRGENLKRVIFSGVPWACEGLGVYGFGVFLPALVMVLGLDHPSMHGMAKVANSVEITAIVNVFILPGFVAGLLLMHRMSHLRMLTMGFVGSALGLGALLVGYVLHLPSWEMMLGFLVFELALNGGPHLLTYIIPTAIYPVDVRGTGNGIAAMFGKVGGIVGVVIMPILIHAGGAVLVLAVSIVVMLLGAAISYLYGRTLLP